MSLKKEQGARLSRERTVVLTKNLHQDEAEKTDSIEGELKFKTIQTGKKRLVILKTKVTEVSYGKRTRRIKVTTNSPRPNRWLRKQNPTRRRKGKALLWMIEEGTLSLDLPSSCIQGGRRVLLYVSEF